MAFSGKEKVQIERDNTSRFERSNDVIKFHPYHILYKAYDRESGLEVTWHEILLSTLSSDKRKAAFTSLIFTNRKTPISY